MESNATQLQRPSNVFISNGEMYIVDTGNVRVRKVLVGGGQDRKIVTIAGNGIGGYNGDNQMATQSQLYYPSSVVVSCRNEVYISQGRGIHLIRKICTDGTIQTIAGNVTEFGGYNGDNQLAVNAHLFCPEGLFISNNDELLFADSLNHRIRMIDLTTGIIKTIAGNGIGGYNGDDQLAVNAQLNYPSSVFKYKNEIYITDSGNNRIRKIQQDGIIKTIAGIGTAGFNGGDSDDQLMLATSAQLNFPFGLHVHNDSVYFSDCRNQRIRKILPNGFIKTIAGNGRRGFNADNLLESDTQLNNPKGVFVSECGRVYFADSYSHSIRMIDPEQSGKIVTIAGNYQPGYSGDVPFDFQKYPHVGPPKQLQFSKQCFVKFYHDVIIKWE